MDTLTRDDLRGLIEQPRGTSVSIFLPTPRAEPELHQHAIRLENLLRQAEARLLAAGCSPEAARQQLGAAYDLLGDRQFWARHGAGLALFAGPDVFRVYRVPLDLEELVVVNERPYVAPLLPLLNDDGQFYVLALGLGGVRLLRAGHYRMSQVALHGVPASLPDALKYDDFAKQAQFHPSGGGRAGAVFYGQGARDGRAAKAEILRYFQLVDHGVREQLHDQRAPLVLAGVAYLLPIYREASTYAHLLVQGVACNPDHLPPEELRARAWALVAPMFARERVVALDRYRLLAGMQLALASSYLRAIVPAAHAGRVDTLFVAAGHRQWGIFEPTSGMLTLHEEAQPRDAELVDLAAAQTLLNSGSVYAIAPQQMPDSAPLAAIFRY